MKQKFLTAYDYGTGGIWMIILANSEAIVKEQFPFLTIVDKQPSWMSKNQYINLQKTSIFDADEEPHGVLAQIIKDLKKTIT
jgi:hypothetical protein